MSVGKIEGWRGGEKGWKGTKGDKIVKTGRRQDTADGKKDRW